MNLLIWLSRPSPSIRLTVPLSGAKENSVYQSPHHLFTQTNVHASVWCKRDAKLVIRWCPGDSGLPTHSQALLCCPTQLEPLGYPRVGYPILPFTHSASLLHSPFLVLQSPHRAAPPTSLPPSPHFFSPSQAPTISFFPLASYFSSPTFIAHLFPASTPAWLQTLSRSHPFLADCGPPTWAGSEAPRPRPRCVTSRFSHPPEGGARERLVPATNLGVSGPLPPLAREGALSLASLAARGYPQGYPRFRCTFSSFAVCFAGGVPSIRPVCFK